MVTRSDGVALPCLGVFVWVFAVSEEEGIQKMETGARYARVEGSGSFQGEVNGGGKGQTVQGSTAVRGVSTDAHCNLREEGSSEAACDGRHRLVVGKGWKEEDGACWSGDGPSCLAASP